MMRSRFNALGGTIDAGPHTATAAIVSGPGGFVGPSSCTYVGGATSASCQVTISSAATAGTTIVSAAANIPVSGVVITRTTGDGHAGDSPNASKTWIARVDLSVTKTGPAYGAIGVPVTYTLMARNAGPSDATGVIVSDSVPAGTTLVSATASQGSCTSAVSCSLGTIAAGGSATVTIVLKPSGVGTVTEAAGASGNETDSNPSNNLSQVTTAVYGFAPGGGAFVLGDGSAGGAVTFWGAQWSSLNSLSGGPAPSAFKGFAAGPALPMCGAVWSSGTGNSSGPPAGPLPTVMAVIVASKVTKSGSKISGDTVHIVIVRTNPGYDDNPGHPGTGTVIATVC